MSLCQGKYLGKPLFRNIVIMGVIVILQNPVFHTVAQNAQEPSPAGMQSDSETAPETGNPGDVETEITYPERVRSWVLLEQAKQLARVGEYGESLRIFREIEARGAYLPEVKLWQGYIFRAEGEYKLAERYYLEALENHPSLYVSEDEFTIRYELAGLYEQQYMMKEYRDSLLSIVEFDENFSSENSDELFDAMERTLLERGFRKWIELYRLSDARVLEAHDRLARFYYAQRNGIGAVSYAMTAFLTRISIIIDELRRVDPEYEFTTVGSVLSETARWDHIREYVEENGFFESVYVFGCILHQAGIESESNGIPDSVDYAARAVDAWNLVSVRAAELKVPGRLENLAQRQLIDPFYDPNIR